MSIPEDAPGARSRLKIVGEAKDGHPGKTSLPIHLDCVCRSFGKITSFGAIPRTVQPQEIIHFGRYDRPRDEM